MVKLEYHSLQITCGTQALTNSQSQLHSIAILVFHVIAAGSYSLIFPTDHVPDSQ